MASEQELRKTAAVFLERLSSHSTDGCVDPLARAHEAAACDAALEELRQFRISPQGFEAIKKYTKANPSPGGVAIYLGAQLVHNEQLKAHLDQQVEQDITDAIHQFEGTQEAELLKHALVAVIGNGSEKEYKDAVAYFRKEFEAFGNSERFSHYRILAVLAQQKLNHKKADQEKERQAEASEWKKLMEGKTPSPVLRRFMGLSGLE
jgi:hypothetical protein